MFNTKLLTYDITVPTYIRDKTRKIKHKNKIVLGVIIANLVSGVRTKTKIAYSRNTSSVPCTSRREITALQVISCVKVLEKEGYVINTIGTASPDPEKREASTLEPTEKFMNEFLTQADFDQAEVDYIEATAGLVLRDARKMAVPYLKTDETEKMRQLVVDLNKLNESVPILTGDGQRLSNIYSRIFNESFNYGGRFYRADVLQLHSKDGNQRLDITIDGQPVVEADFQNLHFRIAAVIDGGFIEDVPIDMYADILEDSSNKVERQIVKMAVNIMFNCRSVDSARRAIQGEINSLSAEEKEKYTLGNAKSVMALIETNYREFSHMFCNEDSFGRVLQNLDSHLAADILEVFVLKEIPILCVHDSFVVAKEHLELLVLTMADKFRERFKIDCPVPMSIKWKDTSKTGTLGRDVDKSVLEKKVVL